MTGMATEATRLDSPTITKGADLDRGLLVAAGLEYESVVMLEPTETGLTVCKLTVDEKIDHTERTGEPTFLGSDEEQDEYFAALDTRAGD